MIKNPFLIISLVLNILLSFILLFLIFQTQLFRFHPVQELSKDIQNELVSLGGVALLAEDVPVGTIVIYQDEIIGRGYNTVVRDNNIAGHAEINALNDAIQQIGLQEFLELDKTKLMIISTYEPCEMCKGTFVHYRISDVKFLKDKSMSRWLKNDAAGIIYEFNKRQAGNNNKQDSLFLLHPYYPGQE